jgi:glycosyltransferase involved in cell wall biosynthesis
LENQTPETPASPPAGPTPGPRRSDLSVIVPTYNEAARILPTLREILAYLPTVCSSFEVIVSDDGSTDDTLGVVARAFGPHANLRLLAAAKHLGKGAAVRQGMREAQGELLLFSDADLSTPIAEIEEFLRTIRDGSDVVIGSRRRPGAVIEIRQGRMREMLGRCFSWLTRAMLAIDVADVTCGFKLFTRRAADRLFSLQRIDGWGFDAEILFLAKRQGLRVKEVPVRWRNDPATRVRLRRDVLVSLKDLVTILLHDLRAKYRDAPTIADTGHAARP